MRRLLFISLSLSLLLFSIFCFSIPKDMYPFSSHQQHVRFINLTTQLRCLVCQNQNLKDSEAPLAHDLRAQIATMIQHKKTNSQIKAYLVAHYGNYILFKPPFITTTYFLWLAPIVLFIVAIMWLLLYIVKIRH